MTLADELIAMGEADLALARLAMNTDDVPLQQAWRRLTATHADRLTGDPRRRRVAVGGAGGRLLRMEDRRLPPLDPPLR